MSSTSPSPFPVLRYALWLAAIVLFAIWPFLLANLVEAIAQANGCAASYGAFNFCDDARASLGETLANLYNLGYLIFITFPLGLIFLLVWAIVLIRHLFRFQSPRA